MSDKFAPASLDLLSRWIFGELAERNSVFGIPRALFHELGDSAPYTSEIYGKRLDTPLGVAAGPHTQLAQNIVVAYLLGARFIELKTVQTLDELEIAKPCIDAEDATYNCEWSQELTLTQSADEYVKAWVLIHALREQLGWSKADGSDRREASKGLGCVFNMSVGYNLEGIRADNVQRFLAAMRDSGETVARYQGIVSEHCPTAKDLTIPSQLSDNITLSTMHGCPPEEIEQIGGYLLDELGVHTAIKMNPTLLGPEMLRGILNDTLGFKDIHVPDEAFAHDTKYEDAIGMIGRLREKGAARELTFGLKLTNTLEVQNHRPVFPSSESMMYMSGRALHPLSINVASRLRRDLGALTLASGERVPLPMSLSGGADAFNLPDILAAGLTPVTVCTDLLKPGGYTRLPQYLERLSDAMEGESADSLMAWSCKRAGLMVDEGNLDEARQANLDRYAQVVRDDERYGALHHQPLPKGPQPLAWFDCVEPPCRDGCPANQNIPEYLGLVATGQYKDALEVIRETNALPRITGCVCDHPCELRCVRNHYDAPLAIRNIKRFVAERVGSEELEKERPETASAAPKVAVVGSGPAGLSAAYYLAKAGCKVTVYEGREQPGGTVSATIPRFRLELDDILADARLFAVLGVKVRYGQRLGRDISMAELHADGYDAIVLATGANIGKQLGVSGEDATSVYDGYGFLAKVREDEGLPLGPHTVIVGGGNAAMDAARTAWRLAGRDGGEVTVVYRRTRAQMPADPDEIIALAEEGVNIAELATPLEVEKDEAGRVSAVRCQRMKLGEPDDSGRRRPVAIPGAELTVPCTTLVVCVSQEPDLGYLGEGELKLTSWGTLEVDETTLQTSAEGIYAGGDVARGPSTIIQAVADGRRIAGSVLERAGLQLPAERAISRETPQVELRRLRSWRVDRVEVDARPAEQRRDFEPVEPAYTEEQARLEARRCLNCDEMCDLCVTVCPNMANLSYQVDGIDAQLPTLAAVAPGEAIEPASEGERFAVAQSLQIVNIADFCNECGNCNTFCPTSGAPYKVKPRLCLDQATFDGETDRAILIRREGESLKLSAKLEGELRELTRENGTLSYRSPKLEATLATDGLALKAAKAGPQAEAGEALSLRPAAELAVLLAGLERSLPWIF
jgi:putative selenate reductase